jgi:hypothetical protein
MTDETRFAVVAACLVAMWWLAKVLHRIEADCRRQEKAERRAAVLSERYHYPEG